MRFIFVNFFFVNFFFDAVFPYGEPNGYNPGDAVDFSDCSRGLKAKPVKGELIVKNNKSSLTKKKISQGDAVFWYSLLPKGHMDGELDFMSLHAGNSSHSSNFFFSLLRHSTRPNFFLYSLYNSATVLSLPD